MILVMTSFFAETSLSESLELKYVLIFLAIVGLILYFIMEFTSFVLMHLPMPQKNIPWANNKKKTVNIMELVKILITL